MFGHVINLNFNRNGAEYKTPIGGCFSIVIKIVIWIYVFIKLYNLFTLGDNSYTTQFTITNWDELGPMKYMDMDFTMFYIIRKQLSYHTAFKID